MQEMARMIFLLFVEAACGLQLIRNFTSIISYGLCMDSLQATKDNTWIDARGSDNLDWSLCFCWHSAL